MSAGWRTLAPSAADVLRRPVPVAGPGVVFALSASINRPDCRRQGGMPAWRLETARGIPQAFQGCPLTKWAREPMLRDVEKAKKRNFVLSY